MNSTSPVTAPVAGQIPLPVLARVLLALGPFAVMIGGLSFMGTSSRRFFEGAPLQASIGAGLFVTGLVLLATGLVLVGVRTMLQQQLDTLGR